MNKARETERDKDKKSSGRPWRDNIEAVTISIVTIVLFKYFVLEAFSFHYRDPERYEVVVFKYPLNRGQNFNKRIVGMPNEELEIREGDLWRRPTTPDGAPAGDWQVLRRPRAIEDVQLRRIDLGQGWHVDGKGWTAAEDEVVASGPGRAEFPKPPGSVRDRYVDGYPKSIAGKILFQNKGSGANEVSDLRVTASVTAEPATTEARIVLREGRRRFRFRIPGPAAALDARPTIEAFDAEGGMTRVVVTAAAPWKLDAGDAVAVLVQNVDDLLTFELPGQPALTTEIPPAEFTRTSGAALELDGGGGRFEDVRIFRDIHYTQGGGRQTRWTIPPDGYVVLGDNPQDSSDARDWSLAGIEVQAGPEAGRVVRGNNRHGENPRWTGTRGPQSGQRIFLRDELGELYTYPAAEVKELPPVGAPIVSRDAVVGRAVLVVWPLNPFLDVYRLQWVR